jgi:hypothetical protein
VIKNKVKVKTNFVYDTPQEAVDQAHAVAVLTEWDEFKIRLECYLKDVQTRICI